MMLAQNRQKFSIILACLIIWFLTFPKILQTLHHLSSTINMNTKNNKNTPKKMKICLKIVILAVIESISFPLFLLNNSNNLFFPGEYHAIEVYLETI